MHPRSGAACRGVHSPSRPPMPATLPRLGRRALSSVCPGPGLHLQRASPTGPQGLSGQVLPPEGSCPFRNARPSRVPSW